MSMDRDMSQDLLEQVNQALNLNTPLRIQGSNSRHHIVRCPNSLAGNLAVNPTDHPGQGLTRTDFPNLGHTLARHPRDTLAPAHGPGDLLDQQALDFKRTAEANGDSSGLKKAEHALKEAGEQIDQLDLFRKNLQSFVRLYEFLSQIVPYEDRELEQLCVYAKHLHPLLRVDRLLQDDVDVGELQLSHYRLSKRAEQQLRLSEEQGDYTLKPGSDVGSGKPHDPEKKRLSEIIEALNDIFGAEVSDDDQLQFLSGIAQRISRQEDVMAQVNNHSMEQVMHGLFPKRVLDTVLDAMTDHEKLSLEVLDNETKSRAFALVILKMLKTAAGFDQSGLHGA